MRNKTAQALSTYLMILFGVSIVFYLGGYKPIIFETFDSEIGSDQTLGQSFVNNLGSIFTNPTFLTLMGVAAVTPFLATGGSFSAVYIVPLFFLSIFANFFILPSSYIFDPTLPTFLKIFIGVFFNLFLAIALMNFIKGGGT